MSDLRPGHRETQTTIPDPLAGRWWHVGTLALPAVSLSIASASAVVAVLLFLQRNAEIRALFQLSRAAVVSAALVALILAGLIVERGRRRPGRIWPRLWALILVALSAAALVIVLASPQRSLSHALAVACLAGAAVLAARLFKLRPQSALVQLIAPLSLLAVLVVVLPAVWWIGEQIAEGKREGVRQLIAQLQRWSSELREVAAHDWKTMEVDREGAVANVLRLERLSFPGHLDRGELWSEAAVLGLDGELSARAQELVAAVVDLLDPARVPRVSTVKEPAVHWSLDEQRWVENPDFPELSGLVGRYHREAGRLLGELEVGDLTAPDQSVVDLQERYRAENQRFTTSAKAIAQDFSDNWAVFRIPQHPSLIGRRSLPLAEVLRSPLFASGSGSLSAGDLWRLSKLSLGEAQRLAQSSANCRPLPYYQDPSDSSRTLYRIDCYAYTPAAEGPGAELRFEMRLVYQSEPYSTLKSWDPPEEVYFLFPLSTAGTDDEYRHALMGALADVSRNVPGLMVRARDRGNSVFDGFNIDGGGGTVRVLPARPIPFLAKHGALEVRVLRPRSGSY